MNGLGSIKGDLPTAQVQSGPLLRSDLANTQVIGKVRTAGNRGADLGDGLQPAEWLLQKGIWRQGNHREPDIRWLDHAADQAHIVVRRQPGNSHAVAVAFKSARNS